MASMVATWWIVAFLCGVTGFKMFACPEYTACTIALAQYNKINLDCSVCRCLKQSMEPSCDSKSAFKAQIPVKHESGITGMLA